MKIAWFNKQSTPQTPASPVEERLSALEAKVRTLGLEWEDTYERIMRALRRLNKRAQDLAAREERAEVQETPQEPRQGTIFDQPGVDPISAKILARRSRVSSGPNGSG